MARPEFYNTRVGDRGYNQFKSCNSSKISNVLMNPQNLTNLIRAKVEASLECWAEVANRCGRLKLAKVDNYYNVSSIKNN